jgi:two-component system alkaline phosphatase synthesis response regulator PhoP
MSTDTNNKKGRILIVDDDEDIIELLEYHLSNNGFDVFKAYNGKEAIEVALKTIPDLIILDIMMPVMDGIKAFSILKDTDGLEDTIMIFLSARKEEHMQVTGLNLGADDYLTKPIRPTLLQSKIESLLRRKKKTLIDTALIKYYEFEININGFQIKKNNNEVTLTKKEFMLFALLAKSPGKVVLRDEIMKKVWGEDLIIGDRTIDVHIRMLRKKLDTEKIVTVKGVGYKTIE